MYSSLCIKQSDTVEYFGCKLDSESSGEAIGFKVLKKLNVKLKFFCK